MRKVSIKTWEDPDFRKKVSRKHKEYWENLSQEERTKRQEIATKARILNNLKRKEKECAQ
jgi:hypothetical protein